MPRRKEVILSPVQPTVAVPEHVSLFYEPVEVAMSFSNAAVERRLRSVMRRMAWHRVAGAAKEMLSTYWGDGEEKVEFDKIDALFEQFVAAVEQVLT